MADAATEPGGILVGLSGGGQGKPGHYDRLQLALGNRHGLIAGATGTGKTVTVQRLVEGFSRSGVPVFVADVKGDLAGLGAAGRRPEGSRRARQGGRRALCAAGLPHGLLGPVRRAGFARPHDGGRDGAAADDSPARAQRHPGGRAQRAVSGRRRAGPAAARPQGLARLPRLYRRPRGRTDVDLRQCRERLGRSHPAQASHARKPGRRGRSSASLRSISPTSSRPRRTGEDM